MRNGKLPAMLSFNLSSGYSKNKVLSSCVNWLVLFLDWFGVLLLLILDSCCLQSDMLGAVA